MLYISNNSLDPHFNLALEEYVLKHLDIDESVVLLWQNKPSVIVGRFQNTIEEINVDYIQKNNIYVVRRITGGGAVYHDLGNLNFTFIEKTDMDSLDFKKYTLPIVRTLEKVGIQAEVSGRNDITIQGKKFSGNSQYHYRGRTLHHGTILFDSNLKNVQNALNVKNDKIISKGVKSVRSRVTNVMEYLNPKISLQEFKNILLYSLFNDDSIQEYLLSEKDITQIKEVMAEKYLTWEWNYGNSPSFNFKRSGRFACGGIEVRMRIEEGRIQACKIYGDFFSNEDIEDLEKEIIGQRYRKEELSNKLQILDIKKYFGTLDKRDLLNCFF